MNLHPPLTPPPHPTPSPHPLLVRYRDTIFSCVKGCLEIWSKFDQLVSRLREGRWRLYLMDELQECYQSEQDNKIQIECFGSLVESIKLVSNISHW